MKRTNNKQTNRPEKTTNRPTAPRKKTNNPSFDKISNSKPDRNADPNKNAAPQKRNPNRKTERLERAKKYSKQPSGNRENNPASGNKKALDKTENNPKEKIITPIRKPFHSKFSEPQKYGKSKHEIKKEIKASYNKDYESKRESYPKKTFTRDRNDDTRDRDTYADRNEKPEFKKESGKTKFIKNLQKFSEKKKIGKRTAVNKSNPSTLALSKPASISKEGTRLNKYLANSGVAARRKCDEIIGKGEVSVNGKVVKEMGHKVMPGDKVTFKNKIVKPVNYVYILLNKPKDYLTTVDDDRGRNTVMELIANATTERVYPVGRLDRNTTGLLLLTNDGDLAQKLSHPSFGAKKLYEVEVDKPVTAADLQKIADGVELEDGLAVVDGIDYAHRTQKNILGIALHIGKNRVVRRIFESLGYSVERLDRTLYAGLTKRDLPRGRWRYLTEREIIKLKYLK